MATASETEGRAQPAVSGRRPFPFRRVVVGVDGSEAGFVACRQVVLLDGPVESIVAVSVVHLSTAVHAGYHAAAMADRLQLEAETALEEAKRILGERAELRFVDGVAVTALLREAERTRADLIAVGSHGHRRVAEIVFGGVSGELLHRAPCSVLIAREPAGGGRRFPRSIVVGVDGSDPAAAAHDAAVGLAQRVGAELRVVSAGSQPVAALVHAGETADLLVVGSRGLHGVRALGSVSERVAHEAPCSVLVVRGSR